MKNEDVRAVFESFLESAPDAETKQIVSALLMKLSLDADERRNLRAKLKKAKSTASVGRSG
jgi:hypothetical protein